MAMRTWEVWEDPVHDCFSLSTPECIQSDRERRILSEQARLVFAFEAGSYEEACAIKNIRLGYGPYRPVGDAAPCPACGAQYWPEGSGECWRCDHIG